MRPQNHFTSRDSKPSAIESVFYSPKAENLVHTTQVTKTKSEKFFRGGSNNETPVNGMPNILNKKSSLATSTYSAFHTEPDRPTTEASKYRMPNRFHKMLNNVTSPDDKVMLTTRESNFDIFEHRNSQMDMIDEMLTTRNKDEIRKIYTAASEFRNLGIPGSETVEKSVGKSKFTIDKRINLISKVQNINRDITHVLDAKTSREFSPVQDPTVSLPEVRSNHIKKFKNFIDCIQNTNTLYPKSTTFAETERKMHSAFDIDLKSTNFLYGSMSPDRSNRLNSTDDFRSTFTSIRHNSGEVSAERLKSLPKISVLNYHYPYHTLGKFDTSEGSYFASLKKILPSVFTSSSVGRPEIVQMGIWLMTTIDSITKDPKMEMKERLMRADEVYNICISELIRQVSCECVERAELITQVWKAYTHLTEDILKENKERETEAINKAKDEVIKTSSLYLRVISDKDKELLEAEERMNIMKEKMERIERSNKEIANKITDLEKENKKLRNLNDRYKKHYGMAVKESKDWEYKYNKIKKDYGAEEVEIEESIHTARAKTKTYEDLSSSEDEQELQRKPTQTFGTANFKVVKLEDKGTDYSFYEPEIIIEKVEKEVQSRLYLIDSKYDSILQDNTTLNHILMEEMIKADLLKQGELIENMLAAEDLTEEELRSLDTWNLVEKLRGKPVEKEDSPPNSEENRTPSLGSIQRMNDKIIHKIKQVIKSSSPRNNHHLIPVHDVIAEESEKSLQAITRSDVSEIPSVQSENVLSPVKSEQREEPTHSRSNSMNRVPELPRIEQNPKIVLSTESEDSSPAHITPKNVIKIKPTIPSFNRMNSHTSIEEDINEDMDDLNDEIQRAAKRMNKKKLLGVDFSGIVAAKRSMTAVINQKSQSVAPSPKAGTPQNQTGQVHEVVKRSGSSESVGADPQVPPSPNMSSSGKPHIPLIQISKSDTASSKTITSLGVLEKMRSFSKKTLQKQNSNPSVSIEEILSKQTPNLGEKNDSQKKNVVSAISLMKNLADKMTTKGMKSITSLQNLDKNSLAVFEHEEQKIAHFIAMYKVEKRKQEEMTEVAKTLESRMIKDQELIHTLQHMLQQAMNGNISHEIISSIAKRIEDRAAEMERLAGSKLKLLSTLSSPQEEEQKEGGQMKIITPRYIQPTKEFSYQGSFNRNSMVILKKQMLLEKKNNPAPGIVKKIKSTFNTRLSKSKSVIPLKSILKQITNFYWERINMARENPMIRDLDMTTFIYRYFINTFGYNKFSLEKFTKFVLSVKKHSHSPRIHRFAKMLGILDEGLNYSTEEAKQFVQGLEFLYTNTSYGVTVSNSDYDAKHFVPWTRASEYIRVFGERHMRIEEINDMRRDIEKFKISDPSGRNMPGIIDIDVFLDKIVMRYQQMMNKHRESYKAAFKCADLMADNKVGYMEFTAMFKTIEPERFDEKKTEEILLNYCDIVEEEEIALSFEKFFSACFDHNLFSENKLNTYIGLTREYDLEKMFEELKNKWSNEMEILKEKIEKNRNNVPLHVLHLWSTALQSIDKNIQENNNIAKKASLIGFKLITTDIYNSIGRI